MLDSGLYAVQLCLSYALMLVAMTYNAWLFLAIILGASGAHFCFTFLDQSIAPSLEDCCDA